MSSVSFRPMLKDDIPQYFQWAEKEHVRTVWFQDGYEAPEAITKKLDQGGNGYDYPYIIQLNAKPIGYIVACDLFAYRNVCPEPSGVFTDEEPGTWCIDLFIGEEAYLNKGYGTELIRTFTDMLFLEQEAQQVLIDPSPENTRAIRCYKKAGFHVLRDDHDGTAPVTILRKEKASS